MNAAPLPSLGILCVVCAVLFLACVALALRALSLKKALAKARAELDAPKPPAPPRLYEGRREEFGLLWYPVVAVKEEEKRVVSTTAGLPHCARCVSPMAEERPSGEWVCAGCGERRPHTAADLQVLDTVTKHALAEFLKRHPGYR